MRNYRHCQHLTFSSYPYHTAEGQQIFGHNPLTYTLFVGNNQPLLPNRFKKFQKRYGLEAFSKNGAPHNDFNEKG